MRRMTTLAAGAMAAVLMALPVAPANADAVIQFNFGLPGGNVGVGVGNGGNGGNQSRLSCRQARRILRQDYGYNSIDTIDCQGDSYKFNAWRNGSRYRVKLNAWTGDLTSARRI
jgi:hypothetical protein